MSLNGNAPFERGFYELPDVDCEQNLKDTCDSLVENGVNVTYGGHEMGKESWLIVTMPSIPKEKIRSIAEEIGIRLLRPPRPV
jgi:hypothetical protein